jgi:Uma2 family endonuclease
MALQTLTTTTAAPPETELLVTGEEFAVMDLGRAELVAGRVIEMTPPQGAHGRCENNIAFWLTGFVLEHKLGIVVTGETGVYTRRNPDSVRGMDVAFISNERWAQQKNKNGYIEVAPDLIVEVLSPDDRWSNVTQKLREYFEIGTRLVWVADTDAKTIFAYRSLTDMREITQKDVLTGDDVLPGLTIPVGNVFDE